MTYRAARIEPITEEGQIFVSEHFAALVEAEGISDFQCDYVGEKDLPKKSGTIRAHILRRR
jgi:class 3 adenylate cyclase